MEEEIERKEKEEFLTKRLNIFLFFSGCRNQKIRKKRSHKYFMAFPFSEHSAYGLVLQKRSIAHRVYCIFAVLLVEASFVYDL